MSNVRVVSAMSRDVSCDLLGAPAARARGGGSGTGRAVNKVYSCSLYRV